MKKICLIFGLGLALFTTANAHSPKTEPKDSKTPTEATSNSDSKTKDESLTYYVTGKTMISGQLYYIVTTTPQAACGSGSVEPCKITSSEAKDVNNRIPDDAVESVLSTRPAF
jgi:hypothetical protein